MSEIKLIYSLVKSLGLPKEHTEKFCLDVAKLKGEEVSKMRAFLEKQPKELNVEEFRNSELVKKYTGAIKHRSKSWQRYYLFWWLSNYKGMTQQKIADIFGIDRSNVTSGVKRALTLMREKNIEFAHAVGEMFAELKEHGYE